MTVEELETWGQKVDIEDFCAEVFMKLSPETRLKLGWLMEAGAGRAVHHWLDNQSAKDFPEHFPGWIDEKDADWT